MNPPVVVAYYLRMLASEDMQYSPAPHDGPIVCPVCWDHTVEAVEGIVLSAKAMGGSDLGQVSIYRCAQWHVFALFNQPKAWV